VLVSSHLMSEMALTADRLVVIGKGRLLADTTVAELVRDAGAASVLVASPDADRLRTLLPAPARTTDEGPGTLRVTGQDAPAIGRIAAAHAVELHAHTPETASLEQAFMDLTHDSVEYQGAPA
ncbi:ABC transporter ATP-binding protein, partial [Streptomyces anthocyanicus]